MRHGNLFRAFCGGFFGTLIMTLFAYMVRSWAGGGLDIATMLGSLIHPSMVSLSARNDAWTFVGNRAWEVGLIWHFVNGTIIFPLLYAYFIYKLLPRWKLLNDTIRGAMWGTILWVLMGLVAMPVLGFGIFGIKMPSFVLIGIEAFFLHAIYGGLFGFIAGNQAGSEAVPHRAAPAKRGIPLEQMKSHRS